MQDSTHHPFNHALKYRSFSDILCILGGALFVVVGIIGFAVPNFLGMNLSIAHNIMHLASGVLALWVGFAASHRHVTLFSFILGLAYLALGILGFIYGNRDASVLYSSGLTEYRLDLIPGVLSISKANHLNNILMGSLFVLAGLFAYRFNRTERVHAPHRGKTPGV